MQAVGEKLLAERAVFFYQLVSDVEIKYFLSVCKFGKGSVDYFDLFVCRIVVNRSAARQNSENLSQLGLSALNAPVSSITPYFCAFSSKVKGA